jgi:hypothetical protein
MSDYDDEIDEELEQIDPPGSEEEEGQAAAPASNRNFLLALGVLGGIFILVTIGLVVLYLSGPRSTQTANINATNEAILGANTQTAAAATQIRAVQMTEAAITPSPTITPVPPTATNTQVVALATATETPLAALGFVTPTPNDLTQTPSVQDVLTQAVEQTRTQQAILLRTATALPNTGFAEDVGLPGLFGMALGLVLMIVLVRRLRLSTSG